MQSNDKKTEELSPFEIFQLDTYGNILNDSQEEENEFDRLTTAELNYIFNNENSAS